MVFRNCRKSSACDAPRKANFYTCCCGICGVEILNGQEFIHAADCDSRRKWLTLYSICCNSQDPRLSILHHLLDICYSSSYIHGKPKAEEAPSNPFQAIDFGFCSPSQRDPLQPHAASNTHTHTRTRTDSPSPPSMPSPTSDLNILLLSQQVVSLWCSTWYLTTFYWHLM